MSVINRMLEDLERRSGEGHQGRVPGQVKAVPARRRVPLMLGLTLVALGAAGAAGWHAWRSGPVAPAVQVAANAAPRRDELRVRTVPTPDPLPPGTEGQGEGGGANQDRQPGSEPSPASTTPQAGGSAPKEVPLGGAPKAKSPEAARPPEEVVKVPRPERSPLGGLGGAVQAPTSVVPPPAAPAIRFDTELNSLRPEGEVTRSGESPPPGTKSPRGIGVRPEGSALGVRPEGEVTRSDESAPPGTKPPAPQAKSPEVAGPPEEVVKVPSGDRETGVRPALPAEPSQAGAVAARPETAPPSIPVPPRPTPVQAKEPAPGAATKGEVTRSGETSRGTIDKRVRPMTAEQRAVNEYRNAVALLQQGRNPGAAHALEAALRLDPAHEAARQTLVGILLHENRVAEAEKTLQAGLDYNPRQVGFAMMLARVQAGRGDSRGALATLAQVEVYATTSAQLHGFMAALLQREGRHAEAVGRYQDALRLAPGTGVWLMGLGISLQTERRLPEAREAFSQARASGQLSADLMSFVDQRLAELKARPGK